MSEINPDPIAPAARRALSVLIVDDMEANRALLARRLEKDGFAIHLAESGADALTLVERVLPDLILLDYMMPQMNGIEVLARLRANPRSAEVPVIMVTARVESDAVTEALAAGADDYVTKPIDFEVLRARIDTQLTRRRKNTHLQRAAAVLDERVTLRSMALADIEGELRDEIRRRQALEAQLASLTTGPHLVGAAPTDPGVTTALAELARKFETIFAAALEGRALNLAGLAEFRSLLAAALAAAQS